MLFRTSAGLVAAALFAGHAVAKTDIAGCVSSQTVAYGGASLIWYVPDTGEVCEFLDCGGGRAPPKTTVPGCPQYEGTATYSPSYLPGFGAAATSTSSSVEVVATESSASKDSSSTDMASITSPPATITPGTTTPSGSVQTQTSSSSDVTPSSSSSAANSTSAGPSTSSVSTGGAVLPTGSIKGAFGVMAGMAAGIALL
ncbi:hypothetical protein F5Y12DRAFT_44729 [Xylaria sp. FL1777]|nr:hypothetical protein F5Y12DRAFT_44729 [Xylaria sp. FL1777]